MKNLTDAQINVIRIQAQSMTEKHFNVWFKNYIKKYEGKA